MAWSLLGPPRNGQAALYPFQKTFTVGADETDRNTRWCVHSASPSDQPVSSSSLYQLLMRSLTLSTQGQFSGLGSGGNQTAIRVWRVTDVLQLNAHSTGVHLCLVRATELCLNFNFRLVIKRTSNKRRLVEIDRCSDGDFSIWQHLCVFPLRFGQR